MTSGPLHPGEQPVTLAAVRSLLADHRPDLAGLALRRMGQSGTDNVIFRLGPDLALRIPRLPHAARQMQRMADWLPRLAPALPLPVPMPLHLFPASPDLPHGALLTAWLPGKPGLPGLSDPAPARALAQTILALQAGPLPPDAPRREGDSLALRLSGLAQQIPEVTEADPARLLALLERLRDLPPAAEPPRWTHGDLHPLNWLTTRGRITALIDWGTLAAGDPAIDLLPAFFGLDGAARTAFLEDMAPSPAALDRARAVALSKVVRGLPYYRTSNPGFHAILRAALPRLWLE